MLLVGKWHNLDSSHLSNLFPKFEEFRACRSKYDPHGMFISNKRLKDMFC